MGLLTSVSNKTISGFWSFPSDGGTIGAITTGVTIPINAVVKRFEAKCFSAITGAGGTISFGWSGSVQALMVTTGIAGIALNQSFTGVDLIANPITITTSGGVAVLMTIAGANLTAGAISFFIDYYELTF